MTQQERRSRCVRRFGVARERLWPALADTARYNEASGFPRHAIAEVARGDGTTRFEGRAKVRGFHIVWDDLPCNWVRGRWFEHTRLFAKGPLARLTARLELAPDGEGACVGTYDLAVETRGLLGRALIGPAVLAEGRRSFERHAGDAEGFAAGARELPFDPPPTEIAPEARGRAERIGAELAALPGAEPEVVGRLVRLVLEGGQRDVDRIRPLALARRWGADPDALVTSCLEAVRKGLLGLSWDLLCPRCRGAKVRVAALDELPEGAHCATCAVDYGRDFARNVEATFHPASAIRDVGEGEFCLLGPMSTPHIVAHLTLGPGRRLDVPGPDLPAGPYRFRTLEPGPEAAFEHAGGAGLPALAFDGDALRLGPAAAGLSIENASPVPRTFVLEERAWIADALTGARLTAVQTFRDLFSDQVLRPGDEVGIERVTILFSDLKGSTALYERVGDAAAYQRVREHFGYLTGLVRRHGGAVVKTIGDAVMAVFADPVRGVAAALAMQESVHELNHGEGAEAPLTLKLGLHAGPCIAVTLNDRLDYFGRTVNLAARLQGQSRGGDVVISAELAADPEIAALLAARATTEAEATLRGFASPVRYLRLALDEEDGESEEAA